MEVTGNIYIVEPEDSFKRVHKSIIENKNIDCLTLGIYTKIIVLGIKWKLNIKGLSTHLGLSDSKIRKSISLLEKEGYVVRTAVRGDGGKFFGWNYQILPTPIDENKRSAAGKPTLQKTDTRLNGQDGEPTTRLTDMSENGQDNNNRLNKIIDLNNDKTIIDNKEMAKNEFSQLFPNPNTESQVKLRGTTEAKRCLFADSRFNEFEKFKECFAGPEFEDVDIAYYYQAVSDWSASAGAKKNDWIATARGFIRRDMQDGKIKRLHNPGEISNKALMDFFNDNY